VPVGVAGGVISRCDELAAISARSDGLQRLDLTAEHARANELFMVWARNQGMRTWVDVAGNVCARREGATPDAPALVLGSHLDTVPDAGWYDGALGVVVALAAAQRLARTPLPFALEVVGFWGEEGSRFPAALLGSRAFSGSWTEDLWTCCDSDGVNLADAFRAFGLDPEQVGRAARAPHDLVGYIEVHIEQGPVLEDADAPLGWVTSISGARRLRLEVHGEAAHAGTTPYDKRRDALVGAAEIVASTERIARASAGVATIGQLEVEHGAVNVVAGRVDLTLDVRAETDAYRDELLQKIVRDAHRLCSARGLSLVVEITHEARTVECAPGLADAVADGIRDIGFDPLPLWSRAGHDAMVLADVTDVGMMFVRCAGGVSHHPDERVTPADAERAVDALVAAVTRLAERSHSSQGDPPARTRRDDALTSR